MKTQREREDTMVGERLRLFFWETVEVLADLVPGAVASLPVTAFAFASTKEQAIDLIVEAFELERPTESTAAEGLRRELVQRDSNVIDEPHGFFVAGFS
jgi:hypothetical protein